jgi:hypothetical protein
MKDLISSVLLMVLMSGAGASVVYAQPLNDGHHRPSGAVVPGVDITH